MLILLASLFLFLLSGIPIAYSLGLTGLAYFALVHPELMSILPARLYAGMNSYAMIGVLMLAITIGLSYYKKYPKEALRH